MTGFLLLKLGNNFTVIEGVNGRKVWYSYKTPIGYQEQDIWVPDYAKPVNAMGQHISQQEPGKVYTTNEYYSHATSRHVGQLLTNEKVAFNQIQEYCEQWGFPVEL